MKTLKQYIIDRKEHDPEFSQGYDSGFEQFKIEVMLKAAREGAGLTQEQFAQKLKTKKSAISQQFPILR